MSRPQGWRYRQRAGQRVGAGSSNPPVLLFSSLGKSGLRERIAANKQERKNPGEIWKGKKKRWVAASVRGKSPAGLPG